MKVDKKSKNKGVAITLGIATAMITLCVLVVSTMFAYAAVPDENNAHTAPTAQILSAEDVGSNLRDDLNTIVYYNGRLEPTDGVTSQYAIAVTSEVAERVFGANLTGRVFVSLPPIYINDGPLTWSVSAETSDGTIDCLVDVKTGQDLRTYYTVQEVDWSWFDKWSEDVAEQERADTEKMYASIAERDAQALASQSQPTAEEVAAEIEIKRQGMLAFAAEMADKPHNTKAVELVNSLGIGDGANAISGAVMMGDADPGDCTLYFVEVKLDNGKYIFMRLTAEDITILSYERSDISMAELYYG